MEHRACPHCLSDQLSDDGYIRTIGVEVRGVYDGALFWQCPDCGHRWHRWPVGSDLWYAAKRYIPLEAAR